MSKTTFLLYDDIKDKPEEKKVNLALGTDMYGDVVLRAVTTMGSTITSILKITPEGRIRLFGSVDKGIGLELDSDGCVEIDEDFS